MEKLKQELNQLVKTLPNEEALRAKLESLVSVYPFNDYEYMISALLGADKLTFEEYLDDDFVPQHHVVKVDPTQLTKNVGKDA